MSFLSCEEMLAAARSQNLSLAEAILRSDLAESRLTEEASRHAMHHLWHVMEATSRDYDPAQRSRSGLSGGDAAARVKMPYFFCYIACACPVLVIFVHSVCDAAVR